MCLNVYLFQRIFFSVLGVLLLLFYYHFFLRANLNLYLQEIRQSSDGALTHRIVEGKTD